MPDTTFNQGDNNQTVTKVILTVVTVWATLITLGSASGFFSTLPLPLLAPVAAIFLISVVMLYFKIGSFQSWVHDFGLRNLTAIHVWRIAATALFFWYGAKAMLPEIFVFNAGWGDLLAGILAVVAIVLPFRLRNYWTFHVIGFADFILAVGTGMAFSLLAVPTMDNIVTFPLALIPLFGVPISGATHIMAFHMMRKGVGFKK